MYAAFETQRTGFGEEEMIRVGESAPDFTGTIEDGSTITLSEFKGKQNVVLYFYLKDFTRG